MGALLRSFDPDFDGDADPVTAGAKAIYDEWSREPDPKRREARWNKLPNCTRNAFEREAEACLRAAARAGWRPS